MSAKKGLSGTLMNLKFMQRAAVAQKVEEKADAEVEMEAEAVLAPAANGEVGSAVQVARKWKTSTMSTVLSAQMFGSHENSHKSCFQQKQLHLDERLIRVVVMEGNPHPGAVKGRMSFQNFNPSIDKLNDEASGRPTQSASPNSSHQDSANTSRTDDVLASRFRGFDNIDSSESISLNELKRKEPELAMETPPSRRKLKAVGHQNVDGQSSSQSHGFGNRKSNKSNKRGKLDYNLLRPGKSK